MAIEDISQDSDEMEITIKGSNITRWLFLGLPAIAFWIIGGLGALSLLGGLQSGDVVPGVGTSPTDLSVMWGCISVCAAGGIILGMTALFRTLPRRLLFANVLLSIFSLFFSVLT